MISGHSLPALSCLVAIALLFSPRSGDCGEIKISLDQARSYVTEMVASVASAFDCEIALGEVKEAPQSFEEIGLYWASFSCSGLRCEEAHKVMSYRGRNRGIILFMTETRKSDNGAAKKPGQDLIGQDLILQVDPPLQR